MRSRPGLHLLRHRKGAVLACMAIAGSAQAASPVQLPVPCLAGGCGAAASGWVSSGSATAVQSGNTLTVQQASSAAILNWASFNIGAGGTVAFQQPASSSVALNRIFQGSPSAIFGQLSANGQLYLINANGFLFGAGSSVNVAGLIASSLNMSDSTFNNGILAAINNPAPNQAALQATAGVTSGDITIASGAQLSAASGGRLLIAAPNVTNSGSLTAPQGQIVLAAGQNVYLQSASAQSGIRGLIVEIDQGGSAWNQLVGALSTPGGNVSLVGLMVNQDGRISATTTVSANGSVRLEAADTALVSPASSTASATVSAQHGGTVTLGAGSSIEVLPDLSDTATAVAAQPQVQSLVQISGEQVYLQGGQIDAPGGTLNVLAAADPGSGVVTDGNPDAHIRIDAGTQINLAGSVAELPMSANLVTVQLRGNEFADDPTQRNGALRGDTVVIDARVGTPIADVASAIAAVGSNVAQRTSAGGTATFQSEGDIVFAPGASINVSGGGTTYDGGVIQTTELVGADGQLYSIGSANPLLSYVGVLNPTFTQTYDKWGVQDVLPTPGLSQYESGYFQGSAAGTVQFAASTMQLAGTLQAMVTNGPFQRGAASAASNAAAPGGTLIIGLPGGLPQNTAGALLDVLAPQVILAAAPLSGTVPDDVVLPAEPLQFPISYLTGSGFSNFQILSSSAIAFPAGLPVVVPGGGSLLLEAPRIDVDSNITDQSGALSFVNLLAVGVQGSGALRAGVAIGDGVTLDVSGQWTNDISVSGMPTLAPTLLNGGSISLALTSQGSELVLGNDVALRANGGAWVSASGAVTGGKGGSITLNAAGPASQTLSPLTALQIGSNVGLSGFGVGTATGGSFSLTAPRLRLAQGDGAWTLAQQIDDLNAPGAVLQVFAPLFSDYGFSSISLTATGADGPGTDTTDALTVQAGTTVIAQTRSLQLQSGYTQVATGGTVAAFTQAVTLAGFSRPVTNVSLAVNAPNAIAGGGLTTEDDLDIQAGASILADPGAQISLTGIGSIVVDGTISAPGGAISIHLPAVLDQSSGAVLAGFIPGQRIELGATALLDVAGTAVMTPNDKGLLLGSVSSGGSVSLLADVGTVITDPGSQINISGSSALLDIVDADAPGGYARQTVGSPAGTLLVNSGESISLRGALQGTGGIGQGGSAAAGTLTLQLSTLGFNVDPSSTPFPGAPQDLSIELIGDTSAVPVSSAASNLAILGVTQLLASGIDAMNLQTSGSIELATSTPLPLARALILDTQALGVTGGASAQLSAPYVALGYAQPPIPGVSFSASTGAGTLSIGAQQLNLVGTTALQGIGAATFTSAGDLQLQGVSLNAALPQGALSAAANLTFNAARIYPDTATSFAIDTVPCSVPSCAASGYSVTIGQTSVAPGTPLSAGGSLSISSDRISSSGTLLAPFGSISLTATNSLTLSGGSVTSVSGAGTLIPYGQTILGGLDWVYGAQQITVTGIPNRQVVLNAPNIAFQSGASINLQGGGDLYAYEWVPGTGGSTDALAPGAVPNLYAILPALAGQAAPYDPQESSDVTPNASIYLSAAAGIAAGYYPLLPARYALLPGAFLVQLQPGYQSAQTGQIGALANGTPVVAGYLSSGVTGLHSGNTDYSGFAIWPGSYGSELAAYTISDASSFFPAAAAAAGSTVPVALPADAGALSINVSTALNLAGTVLSAAAAGGRAAEIDLSATQLAISPGTAGVSAPGVITVPAGVVQGWNAGELILGGAASADGSSISVAASDVTVESGAQLSADQIIIVAGQSIDLQSGAVLASTSGKSGAALANVPAEQSIALLGNLATPGALLSVSDLNAIAAQSPLSGPGGATITLEAGSSLLSRGALSIDAPGGAVLGGTLSGQGASWTLSSSSIGFVGSGSSNDGMQLTSTQVLALGQAAAISLQSPGAINVWVPISLGLSAGSGTPALGALTITASAISNQSGGNVSLGANALTLQGMGGAVATAGAGTLSLLAQQLDLGPGTLAVTGFGNTQLQVTGAVVGTRTGGLSVAGNLGIQAAELAAANESNTAISAPSGTLQISALASAASPLPTFLGGALSLSANVIEDAGAIIAPGGLVTLSAAGDLHLTGSATIDVGGRTVSAVSQTAGAAGGDITLNAGGNVTLDAGALLSVAGAGASSAGALRIVAGSAATVAATLNGNAEQGANGGSFTLSAAELNGGLATLSAVNAPANLGTAGFAQQLDIHVQSGDLDLTQGETLSANQVALTSDTGVIDIAGTVSAPSAGMRGTINLYGGNGVSIEATAQLHADAAGASALGGSIELGSGTAADQSAVISLATGSVITANGAAQRGQLVLRAPALSAIEDVAVNAGTQGIGADVSQVGQVIVEPVLLGMTSSATFNTDLSTALNNAAGYLNGAGPNISARLAPTAAVIPAVLVQTGVELQDPNPNDVLTLGPLDLSRYSSNGQVMDLTIRAAGALTVSGVLSDGFKTVLGQPQLLATPSATLSLVAGAALASANPLAIDAGSSANLSLNPGAIVRTGTGDINLIAAADVIVGAGASAYTAGLPVIAPVKVASSKPTRYANYAESGGSLRVVAGLDILGAPVSQGVSAWQVRQGNADIAANYGVDFSAFGWNFGALGGGDVSVSAGRNALNVSVATADSLVGAPSAQPGLYGAGGGLNLQAGGDIGSMQVFVAQGSGTITAGGSLTAIGTAIDGSPVGSLIALGDSQVYVQAREDIVIDAILNPTVLHQPNASIGAAGGYTNAFFTYGSDSLVSLQSTAGDVTLNTHDPNSPAANLLLGAGSGSDAVGNASTAEALAALPPNLTVRALLGSVYFGGDTAGTMYPASNGQLVVFAGQDIVGSVYMSDTAAADVPTAAAPANGSLPAVVDVFDSSYLNGDIHAGDSAPALITAGQDIESGFYIPKAAQIVAGQDIDTLNYHGQNLNSSDITLISAGRDIIDTGVDNGIIAVGGPGSLDVLAGRNINLGFSQGITTVGNLTNANLPVTGADLTVLAGLGVQPDDAGFLQQIIEPSATYQSELVSYVEAQTGAAALSSAQAESAFLALPGDVQQALIDSVFFNELLLSGREANSGDGNGFARGYAAIDALFPGSRAASAAAPNPYGGDLSLTFTRIYTLSGGNIALLTPGGSIDVGLANAPADIVQKAASELGIVAQGTGNVDIYSLGDVNVNASRIFTLGGGNILIWSDEGSIDAGNGSKTSISVPPPQVVYDTQGNPHLDLTGAAAGSGIQTIQTSPQVLPGNVDLDAPVGTVNAGDAGISASGNINIAAARVIGVDNIQFGGTATGVPAQVSNLGASLSGVSSVASSATSSATTSSEEARQEQQGAAPLAQAALSWLDVFVTGLGEENCRPDDLECLKRQKPQ